MATETEVKIVVPDEKKETAETTKDQDEEKKKEAGHFLLQCFPVPYEELKNPLADMSGREVVFAIVLFLFVSVSLGLSYVIANNMLEEWRMVEEKANLTRKLEKCERKHPADTLCLSLDCLKVCCYDHHDY